MAKRKTPKHKQDSFNALPTGTASPAIPELASQKSVREGSAKSASAAQLTEANTWTRRGMSLLIVLHATALFIAVSANLAPSYLQGRALEFVSPYLNITHQSYNALPLELTRSESIDFPLQVELLPQQDEPVAENPQQVQVWQPVEVPEMIEASIAANSGHRTRWHNLARWLLLVANQDAESEILSDFAARCVAMTELHTGKRFQAIRLVSPKVPSYDEDMAIDGLLRDPNDEAFQPLVVYRAQVVRLGGEREAMRVSLVPAQAAQRTSKPSRTEEVQP